MPKLRADQIPVMNVRRDRVDVLHDGETRLTCPIDGCDWSTIRPDQYAASAREGHRIAHERGMA